jgi:hypothetical protein
VAETPPAFSFLHPSLIAGKADIRPPAPGRHPAQDGRQDAAYLAAETSGTSRTS